MYHSGGIKMKYQLHVSFLKQDQQRNQELARIMGEFDVKDQPRWSASKGDDLLAMMDEL